MPPPFPSGGGLSWVTRKRFVNWHKTVEQDIAGIYIVENPPDIGPGIPLLKAAAASIRRAIATAKAEGLTIRAMGSGWSLSPAPATDGIILDTSPLNGQFHIGQSVIDPGYPGSADERAGLYLFQCGANISQVNRFLEDKARARSLRTTGAANGQTIVGAAATGTHGSALGFGALHDHIVALHLIVGDGKEYWIERASRPVLQPQFAAKLGAALVRDDKLFNAVVMGFGCFGVIAAVVIETRPRFILQTENKTLPLDSNLRAVMRTLDFSRHPALAPMGAPYFFQAVVNPHKPDNETYCNLMYERPCPAAYVPHYELEGGRRPGYDVISVIGAILDTVPSLTPALVGLAASQLMVADPDDGTWGECFDYKAPQAKVASGSIAVPIDESLRALDILIELNRTHVAPLVLGCRYVRRSPALLAFTRFDTSFVVSIDGVYSKRSLDYFREAANRIEAAGIPFTQHWGKENGYTPQRLRNAYGSDLDDWLDARLTLLPDPADRALFANPMMRSLGLAN